MKKTKYFDVLDALRGIAAIAVAIFHFSPHWAGYLAVDFFLVLSGFVLSHSYLYKERQLTSVEFINHRLARLYPLHIFTLITYISVFLLANHSFPGSLFSLIQHFTLTHNIGLNPSSLSFNYPSWSISVEFWVNILFVSFITRLTKNSTLFFMAMLGILIIFSNSGHLDTHSFNYYQFINSGLIRGLSSFLLGILSYRIYLFYKNNEKLHQYLNILEFFCVCCIGALVFIRKDKFSGLDVFAPFLFMLVVAIFSLAGGILSRILIKFKYLGKISYSVYLN